MSNEEQYMKLLQQFDPDLFALKELIIISRINPVILAAIIRAISRVNMGTGYGKIEIFLSNKVIKNVNSQERMDVEEKVEV